MAAMGETTMSMFTETMGFWKRPYDMHQRHLAKAEIHASSQSIETSSQNYSPEISSAIYAARLFGTSLYSAPRFVGQMLKGFIVDVPHAVTEGLRATPQLYGMRIVDLEPVVGWKSGGITAGKNFIEGTKCGFTGLVTQPSEGYKIEGVTGFGKGLAKGVLGAATQTGAGEFIGILW